MNNKSIWSFQSLYNWRSDTKGTRGSKARSRLWKKDWCIIVLCEYFIRDWGEVVKNKLIIKLVYNHVIIIEYWQLRTVEKIFLWKNISRLQYSVKIWSLKRMFTVVGAEFFTEEDQMAVKISMEIKNKLIVIKLICYQIIIVEYWQLRPVEIFPLKEGMNYYLSQSKVVYIYLFLIYYYVSVFNEGCLF